MRYPHYEPLVTPARPTASLLRLGVGILSVVVIYVMIAQFFWAIVNGVLGEQAVNALVTELTAPATARMMLFSLYYFVFLTLTIAIVLKLVHRRGLMSLTGPLPLMIWQFTKVAKVLVVLFAVTLFLPGPEGAELTAHLNVATWLFLLPLSLLAVLVQTSAEEIVFRGYLQSQLAARFAHPMFWMVLPSLGSALLHYDPTLPRQSTWFIVLWAGMFGMAAADLTARAGTLGPAIALHLVNNAGAMLIVASKGAYDGLALYTTPITLENTEVLKTIGPAELLYLLCTWLAARLVLRR